ncbi:MAG: hypothetical protein WC129_00615, partial [Sphaerochaetaceae bacterium]
ENTVDAEFYAVYAKNLSDDTTLFEQRSFEYFYDELHWEYEASLLNVGNWEVYVYALSASVTPETDMSASVAVLRSWHQEDVVVEANSIVELNADFGGDEFSVEQKTSDLVFNFSNIEDLSPYEYFVFSGFDRFDESTTIGDGHAIAREDSEFIDKTYEIPSVPGGRWQFSISAFDSVPQIDQDAPNVLYTWTEFVNIDGDAVIEVMLEQPEQ